MSLAQLKNVYALWRKQAGSKVRDMNTSKKITVTIIYCENTSMKLFHETCELQFNDGGRVITPELYKKGKTIIAVRDS